MEYVTSKRAYVLALTAKLARLEKGYYAMRAKRDVLDVTGPESKDLYKRINKRLKLMDAMAKELQAAVVDPRQYVRVRSKRG
jgi:hypothetical protein